MASRYDFGECYIKRVSEFNNDHPRFLDLHRLERIVGSVAFAGQIHIVHLAAGK